QSEFYCTSLPFSHSSLFFLLSPASPLSTLFPYTTLFRSISGGELPRFCAQTDWCRVSGLRYTPAGSGRSRLAVLTKSNRMVASRSEEHTSELQSRSDLVCRLLLEKKKIAQYESTRL